MNNKKAVNSIKNTIKKQFHVKMLTVFMGFGLVSNDMFTVAFKANCTDDMASFVRAFLKNSSMKIVSDSGSQIVCVLN